MKTAVESFDDIDIKIIKAAEKEFAQRGFHETVVSDIARRANVGKGTVYRHFGSKENLFGIIVKKASDKLLDATKEKISSAEGAEEQLRMIAQAHYEIFQNSRELIKIVVYEGYQSVIESRPGFRDFIDRLVTETSRAVKDGVEAGEFRIDEPLRVCRLFLGQLWSIVRAAILFKEDDTEVRRNYDLAIDIFMRGLKKPGGI